MFWLLLLSSSAFLLSSLLKRVLRAADWAVMTSMLFFGTVWTSISFGPRIYRLCRSKGGRKQNPTLRLTTTMTMSATETDPAQSAPTASSSSSSSQHSFFVELAEVKNLIESITSTSEATDIVEDGSSSEEVKSGSCPADRTHSFPLMMKSRIDALAKFREILDRYLEAPTLLDPYLADMVSRLGGFCCRDVQPTRQQDSSCHQRLAHGALYAVAKVRGRKHIAKFLPHGVEQVEHILNNLEWYSKEMQTEAESGDAGFHKPMSTDGNDARLSTTLSVQLPPLWESVYMLWVWMGMLSLTPFASSVVMNENRWNGLVALGQKHLAEAGAVRDVAAVALASWLVRPEQTKRREAFITEYAMETTVDATSNDDSSSNSLASPASVFVKLGVTQTMATMLKVCSRDIRAMSSLLLSMKPFILSFLEIGATSAPDSSMSAPKRGMTKRNIIKMIADPTNANITG